MSSSRSISLLKFFNLFCFLCLLQVASKCRFIACYDDEGETKSGNEVGKVVVRRIMAECGEVLSRHANTPLDEVNDDNVFRGLVAEMLDMRVQAMMKMNFLASRGRFLDNIDFKTPLTKVFYDRVGELKL